MSPTQSQQLHYAATMVGHGCAARHQGLPCQPCPQTIATLKAMAERKEPGMKAVYIAGPMTGKPLFNFPAFDDAAQKWREAVWHVISPADLTREYWREHFGEEFDPASDDPRIAAGGDIYREFLRKDIAAIARCDAIALLPGWEKSGGVAKELVVARLLGLQELDALTFAPIERASETILQEAQRLVHGDRGADYGHPFDDYTRTGRIMGAILGIPDVDPRIACLLMGAVKMSREVNKHKRDNLTDLAGYAECANMVADRQATMAFCADHPDVRASGR